MVDIVLRNLDLEVVREHFDGAATAAKIAPLDTDGGNVGAGVREAHGCGCDTPTRRTAATRGATTTHGAAATRGAASTSGAASARGATARAAPSSTTAATTLWVSTGRHKVARAVIERTRRTATMEKSVRGEANEDRSERRG